MDWRKHFGSAILERGYNYFKSNAVRIYTHSNDCVEAKVAGTRIYDLRINFKDSQIQSMYCNCPYGGNCKHLAATLYYIDDHPELLECSDEHLDILSSLSHAELIEFLAAELPKNPDLLNRLKLFKNDDINQDYYKNKLKDSFDDSFNVLNFIEEELNDLKDAGQIDLVLTLSKCIVRYCEEELMYYGQYDAFEDIILKIDDLTNCLINDGFEDEVCDFLADCILNCDDESILDLFTDTYSRFRSVEELFDEHLTKIN